MFLSICFRAWPGQAPPAEPKATRNEQLHAQQSRGRGNGRGRGNNTGRGRGRKPKPEWVEWDTLDWEEWLGFEDAEWEEWEEGDWEDEYWHHGKAKDAWDKYAQASARADALKLGGAEEYEEPSEPEQKGKKRKQAGGDTGNKGKAKAKANAKEAKAKAKSVKAKASPKKKGRSANKKAGDGADDREHPVNVESQEIMMAEIKAYVAKLEATQASEIREVVRDLLPTFTKSAMNNIYWARPAVGLTCLRTGTDYAYIRFPENEVMAIEKQRVLLVCVKCAELLAACLSFILDFCI